MRWSDIIVSAPFYSAFRCIVVCLSAAVCCCSCHFFRGAENSSVETQIWAAVQIGSTNLLEQALGRGSIDINDIVNVNGETPFHCAARNGHSDVVTRLLSAGADIEQQDYRGETALMEACLFRRLTCVEVLLNGGAAVYAIALT